MSGFFHARERDVINKRSEGWSDCPVMSGFFHAHVELADILGI